MRQNKLSESAQFWAILGSAVVILGGILTAIGVARTVAGHLLLKSGWFDGGILAIAVGMLCLLWGTVLFVAHRHAEKHMCPDPSAHEQVEAHELRREVRELRETVQTASRPWWRR